MHIIRFWLSMALLGGLSLSLPIAHATQPANTYAKSGQERVFRVEKSEGRLPDHQQGTVTDFVQEHSHQQKGRTLQGQGMEDQKDSSDALRQADHVQGTDVDLPPLYRDFHGKSGQEHSSYAPLAPLRPNSPSAAQAHTVRAIGKEIITCAAFAYTVAQCLDGQSNKHDLEYQYTVLYQGLAELADAFGATGAGQESIMHEVRSMRERIGQDCAQVDWLINNYAFSCRTLAGDMIPLAP